MCDRKSSRRHAGKRESRSSGGAVEGSGGSGGGGGGGGGGGVDGPKLLVDGKCLVDVVWELVISLW